MKNSSSRRIIGIFLILFGLLVVAAGAWLWMSNEKEENESAALSDEILQELMRKIKSGEPAQMSDDGETPPSLAHGEPDGDEEAFDELPQINDGDNAGYSGAYIPVDGYAYLGIIDIPALRISLPVNSKWSYPALRRSPCRYYGSFEGNNLVIMAHAYARHFGRLPELVVGDEVYITDVEGNEHRYQIAEIVVLRPYQKYDVIYSGYPLSLFTCTYGGRSRVVAFCVSW